jgi:hypothetical protein
MENQDGIKLKINSGGKNYYKLYTMSSHFLRTVSTLEVIIKLLYTHMYSNENAVNYLHCSYGDIIRHTGKFCHLT